jgi:hypothetical protein
MIVRAEPRSSRSSKLSDVILSDLFPNKCVKLFKVTYSIQIHKAIIRIDQLSEDLDGNLVDLI